MSFASPLRPRDGLNAAVCGCVQGLPSALLPIKHIVH